MIPYVEIIDKHTHMTAALVEPAECWFELSYYSVGEFEIYCRASKQNLGALKKGNYAKIPNRPFVWVIEEISYEFDAEGSRMVSAKGREAKCILSKRIIKKQEQLPSDLASAVYKLVKENASELATEDKRRIRGFRAELGEETVTINDAQATRGDLGEFVNGLLKTYKFGSTVFYDRRFLVFRTYKGKDRTQSIKFSQAMDNLLKTEYMTSDAGKKTSALVVSNVDDTDFERERDRGPTGIDRSEILIESNLSTEYTPEGATEPVKLEPANPDKPEDKALYEKWLYEEGRLKLYDHQTEEEIDGEIDLQNSGLEFGSDFFLGDLVTMQDEHFGVSSQARILKFTIKQGADGYGEEAEFEYHDPESEKPTATLLTETAMPLSTERGELLALEESAVESETASRKISELEEASSIDEGCCFPLVTYGNTKKISFGTLKSELSSELSGDYNKLTNKPSINSVELSENKTFEDLGLVRLSDSDILSILD